MCWIVLVGIISSQVRHLLQLIQILSWGVPVIPCQGICPSEFCWQVLPRTDTSSGIILLVWIQQNKWVCKHTFFFLLIDLRTYFPKIWCLKSNWKLRFIVLWLLLFIFFRLREKIGDGIQGYVWWPRRGNSPQSKGTLPVAVPHKMWSWIEFLLMPECRRLDPFLSNSCQSTLPPCLLNEDSWTAFFPLWVSLTYRTPSLATFFLIFCSRILLNSKGVSFSEQWLLLPPKVSSHSFVKHRVKPVHFQVSSKHTLALQCTVMKLSLVALFSLHCWASSALREFLAHRPWVCLFSLLQLWRHMLQDLHGRCHGPSTVAGDGGNCLNSLTIQGLCYVCGHTLICLGCCSSLAAFLSLLCLQGHTNLTSLGEACSLCFPAVLGTGLHNGTYCWS